MAARGIGSSSLFIFLDFLRLANTHSRPADKRGRERGEKSSDRRHRKSSGEEQVRQLSRLSLVPGGGPWWRGHYATVGSVFYSPAHRSPGPAPRIADLVDKSF